MIVFVWPVVRLRSVTTGEDPASPAVTITCCVPLGPGPGPVPGLRPKLIPVAAWPLVSDTIWGAPWAGNTCVNPVGGTTRIVCGPLAGSFALPRMTSGPSPVNVYVPLAADVVDGSPASSVLLL